MVKYLVEGVINWINSFPSKTGISQTMSLAMIVEGKSKPDFSKDMIAFGTYALTYQGTDNTIKPRSTTTIALRLSNNSRGHYFMNLHTGKITHSYSWNKLPIDDCVIEKIESLAEEEGYPLMSNGYLIFELTPGEPITNEVEENALPQPILEYLNNNNTDENNQSDAEEEIEEKLLEEEAIIEEEEIIEET